MATELTQSLSVEASRIQVEDLLRGALRESAFADLELLLRSWIDEHPGPLTMLCRDVDAVSISGWDDVRAGSAAVTACTAIGIDLTGHWDSTGPGFEVSYYSDAAFPFSTSDRAAILAATERDAPDWQGRFEDIQRPLSCTGLETLDAALRDYPHRHWYGGSDMPEDYPTYFTAVWFLYLRVNQALAAALDEGQLLRPMPVVVGQHDFGPSFETVYMVGNIATAQDELAVAEVDAEVVEAESVETTFVAADVAELQAEDFAETAVEVAEPDMVNPQADVADPQAPETDGDETELATATEQASEPQAASKGWPWRRSSRGAETEVAEPNPITQRRRGPGSFAA